MLPKLLFLFANSVGSPGIPRGLQGGRAIFCQASPARSLWAYLHHFCAGIRFLLLDMHVGVERKLRNSSRIVLIVSLILTTIGAKLW